MFQISNQEVLDRLRLDNPWWGEAVERVPHGALPGRAVLYRLMELAQAAIRRAVVLTGARGSGKSVLLHHLIAGLMGAGVLPSRILYAALDSPVYTGLPLARLLESFKEVHDHGREDRLFLVLDEIQYARDWQVQLKTLAADFPDCRFIAGSSTALTLGAKDGESASEGFTELHLSPPSFAEYLRSTGLEETLLEPGPVSPRIRDIHGLNRAFIAYVNHGGFPLGTGSREAGRDFIEKALLRDQPSLFGISGIQELNQLFAVLACNTGREVNLEGLAAGAGLAKNTLRRYLDYLEAAFLIRSVPRLDENGRRFQRATWFKVHLTQPALRAALFGPVATGSPAMGPLAETALFGQGQGWNSAARTAHYARWREGRSECEVDEVDLDPASGKPVHARHGSWMESLSAESPRLEGLLRFSQRHGLDGRLTVLSKTAEGILATQAGKVEVIPFALETYRRGAGIAVAPLCPLPPSRSAGSWPGVAPDVPEPVPLAAPAAGSPPPRNMARGGLPWSVDED